ncbi:MAG: carbohydrate ABC transporter permease [Anaerolineae bacterium]
MTSRNWRSLGQNALVYFLLTAFLLAAIMPLVGILLTSLKTPAELRRAGPFALPETWRWENYVDAWEGARFNVHFQSSVIVVVLVVAVAVPLSTMAGYAFGMMRFPGENALLLLIILGLMVPTEAVIIPLWQLMGTLGIRNTYGALVWPQVALSFSFGTFWMRAHFKTMPRDLVDAAVVDGASQWGVLWRILFPLSRPALLSLVVLLFMWTWNEFFLVLVMARGDLRTLPVGLALLRGRYSSDVAVMAAASTIVSLPVILVYLAFQRHFIRGIVGGAVKA